MGRAARSRPERRTKPPAVGTQRRLAGRARLIWAATGGLVVAIGIAVGVLAAARSSATPPPPAPASAADRNAPAALVKAADAVGFRPNVEPGVGVIESKPASAAQSPASSNLLAVDSPAPSFTLGTPEGKDISLADFRGKAVLLEFFATWCPHCAAEAPHLRNLYALLPSSRFAFVSGMPTGRTLRLSSPSTATSASGFRPCSTRAPVPEAFGNPARLGP